MACPKCGRPLYTALSLEDVVDPDAPTAPKILHDDQGDYLACPYCAARIPMQRVRTKGGTGFRLAG